MMRSERWKLGYMYGVGSPVRPGRGVLVDGLGVGEGPNVGVFVGGFGVSVFVGVAVGPGAGVFVAVGRGVDVGRIPPLRQGGVDH